MDRIYERSNFNSIESRDSVSTIESDPRANIKNCLRKFVTFMFSQVGVAALVVWYAILGATGFKYIELQNPNHDIENVKAMISNCASVLWNLTENENRNILNESIWLNKADQILKKFQYDIATEVHSGYTAQTAEEIWTFPAALMFSLSLITMIGYGNMAPKTEWGKGATVIYASIGIPLYILYFFNIGKVLADIFKWIYVRLHQCSPGELNQPNKKIIVPSRACLWVLTFYIFVGTVMFGSWEDWNYLDSTYFCVISLCKIGFGDFVPGANILAAKGSQIKLVINFIYMLLGMGIIAMCFHVMREDVREKVLELKNRFGRCIDEITFKVSNCLNYRKSTL